MTNKILGKKIEQYHHNSNYFGTMAIDKLQEEKIDELIDQVNELTKIIKNHINSKILAHK